MRTAPLAFFLELPSDTGKFPAFLHDFHILKYFHGFPSFDLTSCQMPFYHSLYTLLSTP